MPLPQPVERKKVHRRQITCDGFQRDDGLWEVDAHIVDTKTYSFDNDYRGTIEPGEPLHEMWIRLTVDEDLLVHDCVAATDNSPYQICGAITPVFKKLIGEKIGPGWSRRVKELMGGIKGCTHLVDLIGPATTSAIQTMAGLKRDEYYDKRRKPFFIDGCHAWRSDGPEVLRYFPDHYTDKKSIKKSGKKAGEMSGEKSGD